MPGSCPCRFALWRAHLSLPGRAGSPRPGRESVSKNVRTTAAPSHKEKSGVLKKFAFSFLAGVVAACTRCSGRTWRVNSQSFLNYAENIRRRLRAGFLRSGLEPEGPHNTTAVLSAKRVYHRLNESARRKINISWGPQRKWLQALFLLLGAILLFAQRWIALFLESSCICLSALSGSRRLLTAALESWRKWSGSLRFCNSR